MSLGLIGVVLAKLAGHPIAGDVTRQETERVDAWK
jgi:hypothetical protein